MGMATSRGLCNVVRQRVNIKLSSIEIDILTSGGSNMWWLIREAIQDNNINQLKVGGNQLKMILLMRSLIIQVWI